MQRVAKIISVIAKLTTLFQICIYNKNSIFLVFQFCLISNISFFFSRTRSKQLEKICITSIKGQNYNNFYFILLMGNLYHKISVSNLFGTSFLFLMDGFIPKYLQIKISFFYPNKFLSFYIPKSSQFSRDC